MTANIKFLLLSAFLFMVALVATLGWFLTYTWSSFSSGEVRRIADAYAQEQGYNLTEFQKPAWQYNRWDREWVLFYEQVPYIDPQTQQEWWAPGKHFTVLIDGETGQVKHLFRGK